MGHDVRKRRGLDRAWKVTITPSLTDGCPVSTSRVPGPSAFVVMISAAWPSETIAEASPRTTAVEPPYRGASQPLTCRILNVLRNSNRTWNTVSQRSLF